MQANLIYDHVYSLLILMIYPKSHLKNNDNVILVYDITVNVNPNYDYWCTLLGLIIDT